MTDSERSDEHDQGEMADAAAGDESERLRARIAELEAALARESDQATDYMKRWQYAQADLANLKRRSQQERDDLTRFGPAPLAAGLLEVLDNFARAEQTLPPTLHSYTWIRGMLLIHRQLEFLLEQVGGEVVQTAEQRYDSSQHEAVTQEHHETVPEGVIIAEVQRGYRLHGRLLRPALVRVSQGPAPQEAAPTETPGQQAEASVEAPADAASAEA